MKANHNDVVTGRIEGEVGINIRKINNESKSQHGGRFIFFRAGWDKYQKNRPRSRQTGVAFDNEGQSQRKDARPCVSTGWDKYQKNYQVTPDRGRVR